MRGFICIGKYKYIYGWEYPYVADVSAFLIFPVLSAVWCQSMCVVSLSVVLRCAVCVCSWFRHCIDCRLLLYCWLGLYVFCVKLVLSLYCGCSLQGTCTVDWSYIAYCHSSTISVLCYLLYVRTGLLLLYGGVFCTAVYCYSLYDPSLLEKGFRCSWVGVGHCPSVSWSGYS